MNIPVLRVRDEYGNVINIPAIVGPPGPPGKDGKDGKDGAAGTGGASSMRMDWGQIPAGVMRGDLDYDGEITVLDLREANSILNDPDFYDEMSLWGADADGDGEVTEDDINAIESYITGNGGITAMEDYYGEWTYDESEEAFYFELPVVAIMKEYDALVVVKGAHLQGTFIKAEVLDGAVRIYAKYLPNTEYECVVFYGPGNGIGVVIPESTRASTAPITKLRMASATPGSTTIFTAEIDDDGQWRIYEE